MPSSQPKNINIAIELDIVLNSILIGAKDQPSRVGVPIGQVFVLSHDHEAFDQDGYPEVYLAGEVITKSRRCKKGKCVVAVLAEFPGQASISAKQVLAGISQTEEDAASFDMRMKLRLEDPIRILRRSGGKWTTTEGRQALNEDVRTTIRGWLQQAFESKIQLWSSEKEDATGKIFSALDSDLRTIGLRLDTAPVSLRRYPMTMYEFVLQFAQAEQIILEATADSKQSAILEETGMAPDDIVAIRATAEQKQMGGGAGLFLAIRSGPNELHEKASSWLETLGNAAAANCVRRLYLDEHAETSVKLTEQVLLAAFRNPILGLGEWMETEFESQRFPHFQLLHAEFEDSSSR